MVLGIDMDSFNDQKKEAAQKFLHNIHDELQAELKISKKTLIQSFGIFSLVSKTSLIIVGK